MKSPTTIRRFLLGIVAIGLALYAQHALTGGYTFEATLSFLAAIAVGIFAFPALEWTQGQPSTPVRFGPYRLLGGLLVIAALGLNIGMLLRIRDSVEQTTASDWWVYLCSVVLMLVAALVFDLRVGSISAHDESEQASLDAADDDTPKSWRQHWRLFGWLALFLAIGSILRLYRFDSLPFGTWYDEAINGLETQRLLADPAYRPIYSNQINAPTHYLYLLALAFRLFDPSTEAMRAVSVFMGLGTILAGYLLGRELFRRQSGGLILAFLMAVSRWNVNFSRIGMYNISTPLFTLLSAGFLLRGLRRGRVIDFALAGLALGLGFSIYAAFQIFVALMIGFVVILILSDWRILQRSFLGFVMLSLTALVMISPIVLFAYEKPDVYFQRTQKTSLLANVAPDQTWEALWSNTRKHLLMYNAHGDPNGRHNLPGEPMLDPVAGALLVLGAGVCLRQLWRPRALLPLLWLLGTLMAGILSLDFEAPQSLRAIGSLPAAYILAAVPLVGLWESWRNGGGRYYPRFAALVPALLLLGVLYNDARTYFGRQANDFATWNAFSTPETLTANLLKGLDENTQAYVISYFVGHPAIQFLAPNIPVYKRIETTDSLPMAWPADKDVMLIFNQDSRALYEEARRYYPNAEFEEIQPPFGGPTVVYRARITRENIASIQGLTARYYGNPEWSGEPTVTLKERVVNAQWPQTAPAPMPFSVEWEGVLRISNYGVYQFFLRAPKTAELYIGEQKVLAGEGELSDGVVLAKGNHNLRLRAVGGDGAISLAWKAPDGEIEVVPASALYGAPMRVNGLLGRYFSNGNWQEPESFAQIDPSLNLYFHIIPLPRPYTVEWSGKIAIPTSGDYGFGLESIDESTLFINGQELVVANSPNQIFTNQIALEQGFHDIRIRFADRTDHTHINLYWIPPNFGQQPVPPDVLFPPQANYERVNVPGLAELFFEQDAPLPATEAAPGNNAILPAEIAIVATALNAPSGVAAGLDGRIYVAETGKSRVLILDANGANAGEINSADGPLQEPFDLAVDSAGQLYVADAATAKISIFDSNGGFVRNLAIKPEVAGRARGIFVDTDARIWVARTPGGDVVGLNQEGQTILTLPMRTDEDAQPVDVAVGVGGTIFVVDGVQNKLVYFTAQGQRLFSWDITKANTIQSSHLAVDRNGFVYLTEPESGTVAKLAADGTRLGVYELRQVGVGKPVGIAVDPSGRIWVSDPDRGQVAMITPPELDQVETQVPPAATETIVADAPVQPESPLDDAAQPASPLPKEE